MKQRVEGELQSVRTYLEDHQARQLERVLSLLRQPSVSSEDRGVADAGALLAQIHRDVGFDDVELLETDRYPAVYAYADAGAPVTLGVYGYYDTNVAGVGWIHDPFGAEIDSAGPFPRAVFGVGVATKASYVAWLNAIEALRKSSTLPVNIVALIEGEEWLGSRHVAELIERKRERFARVHSVVWPGFSQTASGEARIALGNKGFLHLKITASARLWGRGPIGPVHGSAQGVLDSPAWHLVDALASMSGEAGTRITIAGFGKGVTPPSEEVRALIRDILSRYRGRNLADVIPGIDDGGKIRVFAGDLHGEDLLTKYMFSPTLNLSGLAAGYTGPGTWQYGLPSDAVCTIDIRMPPGMDHGQTLSSLRTHLDRCGFADIDLEVLAAYGSSQSMPSDAVVRAAVQCLNDNGIDPVIWPMRGSSGPLGIFSEALGVPTLSGFAPGHATQNGPDTYYVLEGNDRVGGLLETELFFAAFLGRFGEAAASRNG